jgi:hypothetical protein
MVPRNSKGLPAGTKAGIAVGIVLFVFLVAGILLWFCTVHRRNARKGQSATSASAISQGSSSGAIKFRASPRRQTATDYLGPRVTIGPTWRILHHLEFLLQ